ncbi:undecaprenyl-diphosphate phosphatase [Embleya sp. AB8]|uniref:undecaprenyl-diphosphate phosphatase n=1 Tax=Embleya sp. AB8 TaxID=3156304 RepID=UPI003C75F846
MGWFEAVVLGLVQGLTEFLPISSSAHLRIVSAFAGWEDPGSAFTAVTQIGTETAVLIFFRKDIGNIVGTWVKSLYTPSLRGELDARMGWYIIIGTVPIGVLGLAFQHTIETTFRDLRLIGTTLLVFGLILLVADRIALNNRGMEKLNGKESLTYGFAQSLALIPGVSRSGGTVTAGLLMGYRREVAARYSFLLAIPAVLASGGLELFKIGEGPAPAWGPTITATVVAFVVGYAAIAWFLKYISTHSFTIFVAYRVTLGLVVLGLVGAGVIEPTAGAAK